MFVRYLLCLAFAAALCLAVEPELPQMEFKPVHELPADIPTCSQDDLNINDCIKQAFQQMMPRLKYGVKELNIPPLDPFVLDKSSFTYTQGILQGRISMRNVRVHGLSAMVVDKVNFRLKDNQVRMEILSSIPQIYVEGDYKANIKLNDMKLTPKGYFNITMSDVKMKARPVGELYENDGHTYLRLQKFDSEPTINDMRIYASGLVPDPALNAVILDFVNQYWRQLYKAMLPETLSTWQPLMLKSANEFFAALPFDLLVTKH